jgi:2-polyprenyl-6-methoxyphenol hydroxylase-like FAD-dependent oxidoreductase
MPNIGIVGAGVAGLHLGIALRRHGIETTIYADRSADDLASGGLLNTVMHHHLTLAREKRLGVDHWDAAEHGWQYRYQHIHGPAGCSYAAAAPGPSLAVDYRLYLPTLMTDFAQAGGRLIVYPLGLDELETFSNRHDLLVVATGRSSMQLLFPTRDDLAGRSGVRRSIVAALVLGVTRPDPEGVTISFCPGVGELIEFPMLTAGGKTTALLLETVPAGVADDLVSISPDTDPVAFTTRLRTVLADHFPGTSERIDESSFALVSPRDTLRGSLAPTIRKGSSRLPGGRLAVALGDTHVLVDPVMGQGANIASYSAEVLADAIAADLDLDDLFCSRLNAEREPVLHAAYAWTNLVLDAPAHLLALHRRAAANNDIAADFARRYSDPELMWRTVATRQRAARYLEAFASPHATSEEK